MWSLNFRPAVADLGGTAAPALDIVPTLNQCVGAHRALRRLVRAYHIAGVGIMVLALGACADHPQPAPGIEQPAPPKPDPTLCAAIEPAPPVAGGILQPVTPEQQDAVSAFLRGEADLFSWGGRGWKRAELAKTTLCH